MAKDFVICRLCGHSILLNAGVINCPRCYPTYPAKRGPRVEMIGTLQGLLAHPITKFVERSPTIDVLDLDRSALRALEEIAKCG